MDNRITICSTYNHNANVIGLNLPFIRSVISVNGLKSLYKRNRIHERNLEQQYLPVNLFLFLN